MDLLTLSNIKAFFTIAIGAYLGLGVIYYCAKCLFQRRNKQRNKQCATTAPVEPPPVELPNNFVQFSEAFACAPLMLFPDGKIFNSRNKLEFYYERELEINRTDESVTFLKRSKEPIIKITTYGMCFELSYEKDLMAWRWWHEDFRK